MVFDFKKEEKQLYTPSEQPVIVDVPEMTFLMADGKGDPNTSEDYKNAVAALYAVTYAIKMSKGGEDAPEGFFDFVVPPLEGLWRSETPLDKDTFEWTCMIRLPDFVTQVIIGDFALKVVDKKPDVDFSVLRLEKFTEGLCGQITHTGSFDNESATIEVLEQFIAKSGYKTEISGMRQHHEIYLSDPRKTAPEKMKTLIRHPLVTDES